MLTINFLHELLNIEATVSLQASVVDPNSLNLDPDPGFWPNLDPDPGLDPGFYIQSILKKKIQNFF